jgi:hypothetical protein
MIKNTSFVYSWFAKPYSLIFTISALFFLFFGITFFIGYQQYKDTKGHLLSSDRITANLLSHLIAEHQKVALIASSGTYKEAAGNENGFDC